MRKFLAINITILILTGLYIFLRFAYLNSLVPLWMSKSWGEAQLANKYNLYLLPVAQVGITFLAYIFANYAKKKHLRYGADMLVTIGTTCNVLLSYSVLKIIRVASTPYPPFINPTYIQLAFPMFVAFLVVLFIAPYLINFFKEYRIVTDPNLHKHPGMLLAKPSARGGGLIFTLGILLSSIFFVKFTPTVTGLLVSMALAAVLGILDDIQNTKSETKLSSVENPWARFGIQALIVLPIVFAGVQVLSVNNPLDGALKLDILNFAVNGIKVYPVAIVFTLIWILWIINLLSWSNGVDGQYSGIVTIAAIVIAVITLRETNLNFDQKNMVQFAAIVAGASLGLLPFTWNPSKVMWGFGAIAAGLAIATLSILTKAKVATALIVLAVPFLDGFITVVKRILQKKSPLKGDRGHLHHILLNMGWSVRKVAVFYWIATAITGYIGIKAADRNLTLSALVVAGVIAFIIILINMQYFFKRKADRI
ncbi:undecaprenyl/decaprenyl-phosphate alpha-N-acetylglucosaminyl 1-phosphate transferase [candidate division WWE3 bacterium]|nr:undecaprenyl/decaprenyl-phosphate alpha-N-acetylglucosaminyl 1-phosphate transferase [candidate division WWE3 bacterium]